MTKQSTTNSVVWLICSQPTHAVGQLLALQQRWAIWRSTSAKLAIGSAAVPIKMHCIEELLGSHGQGVELPDGQEQAARGFPSETRHDLFTSWTAMQAAVAIQR